MPFGLQGGGGEQPTGAEHAHDEPDDQGSLLRPPFGQPAGKVAEDHEAQGVQAAGPGVVWRARSAAATRSDPSGHSWW
jgi:hypothetical protein